VGNGSDNVSHAFLNAVVINRRDHTPLRTLVLSGGHEGPVDAYHETSQGVCFVDDDGRRIAVADPRNTRVSVFSIDGSGVLLRNIGVEALTHPTSVACSDCNELVVGDIARVFVFDVECGDLLMSFGRGADIPEPPRWRADGNSLETRDARMLVAVRDGTVYAKDCCGPRIFVYA
jgi:hypothetical protein